MTDDYGGTTDEYSSTDECGGSSSWTTNVCSDTVDESSTSSSDYTGTYHNHKCCASYNYSQYIITGSDASLDWEYVPDETLQVISQSQPMFSKGGHSYTPEGWVRKYNRRKSLKATAVAKKLKFDEKEKEDN